MEPKSSGLSIGSGANIGSLTVGDVAGRDLIKITEEQSYDVSGLADPYLGLASYTYETRDLYGGREEQIKQAVDQLTAPGAQQVLLFITGASGCGKSSFVQAGLVPALERAYEQRGRHVRWAVTRPGQHPLAALKEAFEKFGEASPARQVNVLVLDQFEELMTQSDPSERAAVFSLLSNLPSFDRDPTHVIVALRSDYLQMVFQMPALFDVLKRQGIELRAMDPDELARAISRPLEQINAQLGLAKRIQPDLLQRLIEDVGDDPSLLPLLQVTMTTLWDEPPHQLKSDRYRTLTDALQAKATRVYERDRRGRERPEAERSDLMTILLDLVRVSLDDDAHRDVRQTLTRRELLSGHPELAPLVEELVENRLLATWVQQRDGQAVEVVDIIHETLLRNWTKLREAIDAARDVLQGRERFRLFVREWEEHERAEAYLLQGVQLDAARELAERNDIALQDAAARQFFDTSLQRAEQMRQRELAQERARSRGLRNRLIIALGALAVAVVATGAAVAGFIQADQQAHMSASRELAVLAEQQLAVNPELSILLAAEGLSFYRTDQAATDLRRSLLYSAARLRVPMAAGRARSVALSPDGTRVAIVGEDPVVQVQDASSGVTLASLRGPITAVRFSTDGQQILSAGSDGSVRLWSVGGDELRSFAGIAGQVHDAAFSADGSRVVGAGSDGLARVWDARTGQPQAVLPGGNGGPLLAVRFAPDGQRLVGAGQAAVRIWDVDSGQVLADVPGTIARDGGPVFDRAGQWVVTLTAGSTARVWSAETGAALASFGVAGDPVRQAVFSPTEPTVLTVGDNGVMRVWDVRSGQPTAQSLGLANPSASPNFSRDGSRVVAAGSNYDVLVWDVPVGSTVELHGHTTDVTSVQLSADGRTVASTGLDRTVRTWNADAARDWLPLAGHSDRITSVAATDGGRLVTGSLDQTLRFWRLQGGTAATIVRPMPAGVMTLAVSRDGRRIAAGLEDGRTWLLDTDTPQTGGAQLGPGELELGGHSSYVNTVAFSPDGQRLATTSVDGTCRLWDAHTGQSLGQLPDSSTAFTGVAFDPRGQWLVTATTSGSVRLWDARTLQPGAELRGFTTTVNRVTFSPDGQLVLAGGGDKTEPLGRVWSVATGREVAVLRGHTGEILGVRFSPSGRLALTTSGMGQTTTQVVVGSGDGLARVYGREAFAPFDEVQALVRRRVLREPPTLTAAERARYVPSITPVSLSRLS